MAAGKARPPESSVDSNGVRDMQTVTTRNALVGKAGMPGVPGGTPVSEFLLIPFGPITVERALSGGDFTFTRAHALAAVEWFGRQGRTLAIDYEHQSLAVSQPRADALRPAAGWIGKLQVRGDGLWAADVEWTEKARTLLATGEYRYFSPVIYWADDNWSELTGLGPVALTNDPAMSDVVPLAASTRRQLMVGTVMAARPLVGQFDANDAGDGGESGVVEAFREAHVALMGVLDDADAATRGAIADELSAEDYQLFDAVSGVLYKLREMTSTAAGRRGGVPAAGGAAFTRGHGRAALIAAAKRTYATEATDPTKITICSARSWVNVALRDAHQQPLSDREITEYGISESDAPNSTQRGRRILSAARSAGGAGTNDRAYILAAAKREFATWVSDPAKRVICDELAHVNTCLRDAGQAQLTRDEMIRHNIVRRG